MKLLKNIFKRKPETRATGNIFYNNTEQPVTSLNTVLRVPAVRKCLDIYHAYLSEAELVTRSGGSNSLTDFFNENPNGFDTRSDLIRKILRGFFLYGNSYALVTSNPNTGMIESIKVFADSHCYAYPYKNDLSDIIHLDGGYFYRDHLGNIYHPEQILHLADKTFSQDQINGRSRVQHYFENIQTARDLQSTRSLYAKSRLALRSSLESNINDPKKEIKTAENIEKFTYSDGIIMTMPPGVAIKDQKSLLPQSPGQWMDVLYKQSQESISHAFGVPVELISRDTSTNLAGLKEVVRLFVKTQVQGLLNQIAEKLSQFSNEPLEFRLNLFQRAGDLREITQFINAVKKDKNGNEILTKQEIKNLVGL